MYAQYITHIVSLYECQKRFFRIRIICGRILVPIGAESVHPQILYLIVLLVAGMQDAVTVAYAPYHFFIVQVLPYLKTVGENALGGIIRYVHAV